MNNAKLWLVVKPTVGIPLFLSAVAIGSFAVHVAVVSQVSWYNNYLTGKGINATASLPVAEGDVAKVSYTTSGSKNIIVTMPDGSLAHAVLTDETASLN